MSHEQEPTLGLQESEGGTMRFTKQAEGQCPCCREERAYCWCVELTCPLCPACEAHGCEHQEMMDAWDYFLWAVFDWSMHVDFWRPEPGGRVKVTDYYFYERPGWRERWPHFWGDAQTPNWRAPATESQARQ